jgi:hypothetical protein
MARVTDQDGYPTRCHICGEPIVRKRHDSRHHYDHATRTATSRHTTCDPNVWVMVATPGVPSKPPAPSPGPAPGQG